MSSGKDRRPRAPASPLLNAANDDFADADLNAAPKPLPEHARSYAALLTLLRSYPRAAAEPLALPAPAGDANADSASLSSSASSPEHLLHHLCACPGGANCSVVGLLLFAHPGAVRAKSPSSGLSALQTALLHSAPLDVVTLLFELEADQRRFCRTRIGSVSGDGTDSGDSVGGGGLLPIELLLLPVRGSPYELRVSPRRHALFMRFAAVAWESAAAVLDLTWVNYHAFWKGMEGLGHLRRYSISAEHCSYPDQLLLPADRQGAKGGSRRARRTSSGLIRPTAAVHARSEELLVALFQRAASAAAHEVL